MTQTDGPRKPATPTVFFSPPHPPTALRFVGSTGVAREEIVKAQFFPARFVFGLQRDHRVSVVTTTAALTVCKASMTLSLSLARAS